MNWRGIEHKPSALDHRTEGGASQSPPSRSTRQRAKNTNQIAVDPNAHSHERAYADTATTKGNVTRPSPTKSQEKPTIIITGKYANNRHAIAQSPPRSDRQVERSTV